MTGKGLNGRPELSGRSHLSAKGIHITFKEGGCEQIVAKNTDSAWNRAKTWYAYPQYTLRIERGEK